MRILLDENLPRRLAQHFPSGCAVTTVQGQGWSGKRNGELLTLAEGNFDVFVTMDQNLEYQQNLSGYHVTIVLLHAVSNRLADLLPLMPELIKALDSVLPGTITRIPT